MKCPHCQREFKDEGRARGGRARVPKGFASPAVQKKAQATRKRNREMKF